MPGNQDYITNIKSHRSLNQPSLVTHTCASSLDDLFHETKRNTAFHGLQRHWYITSLSNAFCEISYSTFSSFYSDFSSSGKSDLAFWGMK